MAKIENVAQFTELLKAVACESLSKINVPLSCCSKEKGAATEESYEALKASLTDPQQTELLEGFDAAFTDMLASEATDNYITGFMQGYLFFKKHQEKSSFAGNETAHTA
jgi:hypothetical protein